MSGCLNLVPRSQTVTNNSQEKVPRKSGVAFGRGSFAARSMLLVALVTSPLVVIPAMLQRRLRCRPVPARTVACRQRHASQRDGVAVRQRELIATLDTIAPPIEMPGPSSSSGSGGTRISKIQKAQRTGTEPPRRPALQPDGPRATGWPPKFSIGGNHSRRSGTLQTLRSAFHQVGATHPPTRRTPPAGTFRDLLPCREVPAWQPASDWPPAALGHPPHFSGDRPLGARSALTSPTLP